MHDQKNLETTDTDNHAPPYRHSYYRHKIPHKSCKYPDAQTDLIIFKAKEEGAVIKTMVRIAKHNLFHK